MKLSRTASNQRATLASRRWRLAVAIAGILALAGGALAQAEVNQQGNLRVAVSGKLSPHLLPRRGTAPVSVSVGGKIATTDATQPPQLQTLTIEINRNGRLDATGLPTCNVAAIRTASNGRALSACGSSLLGEGKFFGTLSLPGAEPYPLEGKLLVFNGTEGKKHVLLGHVYSPHPFATSFVITFDIKSGGKGTYGTVLVADMQKALGTQKNLTAIEMTLDRRYSYRGKRRSYVSAGCPAPQGVNVVSFPLARTSFSFADKRKLTTVLNRSCRARG
jgi:hypothetical protein